MNPTVLLVEDDPSQRRILGTFLAMAGFDVDSAESAEEGLLKAQVSPPLVVITDYHLPGMGGIEFCRHLRGEVRTERTFLILATADEGSDVKEAGLLAGADDFIRKPVRSEELVARVRMGVRVRSLMERIHDLEDRLSRAGNPVSADILRRLLAQMARAEQVFQLGNTQGYFDQTHRALLEARRAFEVGYEAE